MALIKELEKTGNWLFRYRSYLPIIIIPLLLYALHTPYYYSVKFLLLILGVFISIIGEIIRIFTISYVPNRTSGRNTNKQLAESLNSTGLYSIVRHPLYLGNFFIYLGPFIYTGNFLITIIFILLFWLYYERIMIAEEFFLVNKFGDKYNKWSSNTPAFIPKLNMYSPSKIKIPFIIILFREYSGICGIVPLYSFLIIYNNYIFNIYPIFSNLGVIVLIINTIIYLLLRTLKKYSNISNKY